MEPYRPPKTCSGCFEKRVEELELVAKTARHLGKSVLIPLCPVVAGALVEPVDRPTLTGYNDLSALNCRKLQERGVPRPTAQTIGPEKLSEVCRRLLEIQDVKPVNARLVA